MIKVGIVGSREKYWIENDCLSIGRNFINNYIWKRRHYCEFVSGESPAGGVDEWTKYFCETRGLYYKGFAPKKNIAEEFKKRNTQIADYVHILVAFCPKQVSNGTKDTIRKAIKQGKYVIVYTYDGEWKKEEFNKPDNLLDYIAELEK